MDPSPLRRERRNRVLSSGTTWGLHETRRIMRRRRIRLPERSRALQRLEFLGDFGHHFFRITGQHVVPSA